MKDYNFLDLKTGFIIILLLWLALTVFVQFKGTGDKKVFQGVESSYINALIIYNPDPIYNFDLQVCENFAKGLLENKIDATIITIKHNPLKIRDYDLIVFCANTYNFAPDWGIQEVIKNQNLKNKYVANISLGAGATANSEKKLNNLVLEKGAILLGSHSFWLSKPNDLNIKDKNNIEIAKDHAKKWATDISNELFNLESNKNI